MYSQFRQLRQSLLKSNSSKVYILYAIGEIGLVVLGILIALGINNWNEERKKRAVEYQYLISLQNEFKQNLEGIAAVDSLKKTQVAACEILLKNAHPERSGLTEEQFTIQLENGFKNFYRFYPAIGTVQEMINSGSLSLLSNRELKIKLTQWQLRLEWLKEAESESRAISDELLRFFVREGNFRDQIVNTIPNTGLELSSFPSQNEELLQNPEFENIVAYFAGNSKRLSVEYYLPVKQEIQSILNLIESEL